MLNSRSELATRAKTDPSLKKNLEQWYGKDYAAKIAGADATQLAVESERLFVRVAEQFSDVKYGAGSLADKARTDLFEIRNLSVGKVAPEISGTDQDGKAFRLSDYRGKVVMLDFWGEW